MSGNPERLQTTDAGELGGPPGSPAAGSAGEQPDHSRVARGLISLVISQLLQMPLSMLVNAVLARKLGPQDFGAIYLASTTVGVGFLFVEWGQSTSIAGAVARDRSRAPALLGTSLLSKVLLGALATAALSQVGQRLGYAAEARTALLFLSAQALLVSLQQTGAAVLRGHERTDLLSGLNLFGAAAGAALTLVAALAGSGLAGVLLAMVAGSALLAMATAWLLARFGVLRPRLDGPAARELLGHGSAFLVFTLVLSLQPYVDAAQLARLAGPEVMGWHAAARRMTGLLIFPATTLGFTLYPTLSRLHQEDPARQVELMRGALRMMVLTSVPAAMGTALFAGPAVHLIYGKVGYEGAVLNLQILALWVLLVYFSILFGSSLVATGRIKAWTAVQAICVVVSVLGNPPLVRLFHDRFGNGAAGVSVSSVISEVLMVAIGGSMLARTLRSGGLLRAFLQAGAGGAAMAAVAWVLGDWTPLSIAGSLAAYGATLWALGALRGADLRELVAMLRSKAAKKLEG